jgi:hypothetical protein
MGIPWCTHHTDQHPISVGWGEILQPAILIGCPPAMGVAAPPSALSLRAGVAPSQLKRRHDESLLWTSVADVVTSHNGWKRGSQHEREWFWGGMPASHRVVAACC